MPRRLFCAKEMFDDRDILSRKESKGEGYHRKSGGTEFTAKWIDIETRIMRKRQSGLAQYSEYPEYYSRVQPIQVALFKETGENERRRDVRLGKLTCIEQVPWRPIYLAAIFCPSIRHRSNDHSQTCYHATFALGSGHPRKIHCIVQAVPRPKPLVARPLASWRSPRIPFSAPATCP